jgi:hypothetical protein
MVWLLYACASAVTAALTAILAKIGIEGVPSNRSRKQQFRAAGPGSDKVNLVSIIQRESQHLMTEQPVRPARSTTGVRDSTVPGVNHRVVMSGAHPVA